MADHRCDCCEPTAERSTDHAETTDRTADLPAPSGRWLADRPVTDATLPADVATWMGRLVGVEPFGTLGDFVAAAREALGGPLVVEDLCHVDEETPHRATTGGETYHFRCFFDGVALSHIVDEAVEIRTEGPAGEPITVTAWPDGEVDVAPPDAAMSFGVARDLEATTADDPSAVDPAGDGPSAVEANVCPYVRAFPGRDAYERWAERVDAATVGLPLADGVPVARDLAG